MRRCAKTWDTISARQRPPFLNLTGLAMKSDEWLKLIEASTLEERYRLAANQTSACLRDLTAAGELHNARPVVTSLIQAVEQRDSGL